MGDVGHPTLVRGSSKEVALHEVWSRPGGLVSSGGATEPPAGDASDSGLAHQPGAMIVLERPRGQSSP
jgi:hypothetical protein